MTAYIPLQPKGTGRVIIQLEESKKCLYECKTECVNPYHYRIHFAEWPDPGYQDESDKGMIRVCIIGCSFSVAGFIALGLAYVLHYL